MVSLPVPAQSLIERIADGAFLRDIAIELNIDKRRLSEVLRKEPNYQAAKESAVECQLEEAQLAIRDADEQSDIARAREMFRAAAWRAEREFPQRWGAKQQIEMTVAPVINFVMAPVDNSVNAALQMPSSHPAIPAEFSEVPDK